MHAKKSLKACVVALLLAGMLASPSATLAYGGGIPPIIGVGPRIEHVRLRLNLIKQRLEDRIAMLRVRIFIRFRGIPIAEL